MLRSTVYSGCNAMRKYIRTRTKSPALNGVTRELRSTFGRLRTEQHETIALVERYTFVSTCQQLEHRAENLVELTLQD